MTDSSRTQTLTGQGARAGTPIEAATQWNCPPGVAAAFSVTGSLRKAPSESAAGAPGARGLRHQPREAHMVGQGKGGQRQAGPSGSWVVHTFIRARRQRISPSSMWDCWPSCVKLMLLNHGLRESLTMATTQALLFGAACIDYRRSC